MNQAFLVEPRKLVIRQLQTPVPASDEILVSVGAAGICGSDLHTYRGANPAVKLPLVPGHECAGTIVQAGASTGLQAGQRIALEPDVPCGKCAYCLAGQTHLCTDMRFVGGTGYDGCFADFVIAPASAAIPLPSHMSLEEGAFVEPVAVACHALELAQDVTHDNILVLGAGTIGNLVAQTASLRGAHRVGITDISDAKLDVARKVGIEHTANPSKQDVGAWVADLFGPTGPDVTYDCVGLTETINQALVLTRKSGLIVMVGVPTQDVPIKPMELLLSERCLKGCYIYRHGNFIEALDLLTTGRIRVQPLISRVFDLNSIDRAFAFFDNRANEAIKVLIKP
jgi:L-iditol 2-dehydrogenase